MRIYAHAAVATAAGFAAPLFMAQSPIPSVTSATPSIVQTQTLSQTNTTIISAEKSDDHSVVQPKKPKKVIVSVKAGDSLSRIATTYHTTWVRLFNANNQIDDPNIIHPGQKITVPSKDEKLPNRYEKLTVAQVATMPTVAPSDIAVSASPASAAPLGGANTYTYGYCTWYVKNKRPDISNHWGNAGYQWLSEAQADGYSTGSIPRAGAIAVTAGHVAYVTGTSNHGQSVSISEMNYGGGVGVVHTRTVASSSFQYIY